VVEELDLHEGGRGGDAPGEFAVGAAGGGVSGGMVVDEDEPVGPMKNCMMEDIPRMGDGLVDGAVGHGHEAGGSEAGVEEGEAEGFAGKMAHLRRERLVDKRRGVKGSAAGLLAGDAGPEFDGGGQLGGLGETEAVLGGKLGDVEPTEGGKTTVGAQEASADIDGALALHPDPEEDGNELRIAESGGPFPRHPLPGPEGIGKIVDPEAHPRD
jgi:hypothetical protein